MAGSGLASSGKAGRREEKHGQPVPKVGRWGARANRDAGGGFHIAQLNPAGVTAPGFRARWCSRERETAARWGACQPVRCGQFSRSRPIKADSANRLQGRAGPPTDSPARRTRRSDAGRATANCGRPTDSARYVPVSNARDTAPRVR